jgi:hypothetical protein
MEWCSFVVDGETFFWTAYSSSWRTGDGPEADTEYLTVSRAPNVPGVGRVYDAGTVVTEEHAVDTVRLFRAHGREIPEAPP